MTLELHSVAFEGEMIPSRYTCDGDNVSPPLSWDSVPKETESLVLMLEDIDSVKGVWSHWVVYDLPPGVSEMKAEIPQIKSLTGGGAQGRNDFDEIGYGGPCPSDGKAHRYVVRLFALDERLGLAPGATREEVLEAIDGHVIEEIKLRSPYKRLKDR